MNIDHPKVDQPRSYFARKLAADPVLAAQCEALVTQLREEAEAAVGDPTRSEVLGSRDFCYHQYLRGYNDLAW